MLRDIATRVVGKRTWPFHRHARVVAVPILLITALAIAIVVITLLWASHRTNEVALSHERQLVRNALTEKSAQMLRELVSLANSDSAVRNIWIKFDPNWIDARIGLRLSKVFGHDYIFVADGKDRLIYALAGQTRLDPDRFSNESVIFQSILDALRSRPPQLDEPRPDDRSSPQAQIRRQTTVHLTSLLGRPAVMGAAVIVSSSSEMAAPNGSPPVLIGADLIDEFFLAQVGFRLNLTNLRLLGATEEARGDQILELTDMNDVVIARLAWSPKLPSVEVATYAWPFVTAVLIGFGLLVLFIFGYMHFTSVRIAAGEDQLRHLALHDPLSGLPNRTFYGDRLLTTIDEVARDGESAAVLAIDLDQFKEVNDTLGHHVGDALIGVVAQRLQNHLRPDDFVARLGGDEFAVITGGFYDANSCIEIADRLIGILCAPYSIMGHTIFVGASIGIAMIDPDIADVADIMRRADVALYRAKNEGGNRAFIYDSAMDADLRQRKKLENDLRDAIERNELRLEYQPLMRADGARLIAVEALARWNHPTRGEISPNEFIPIAEHSGLIVPVGEWVLRRACLDAKEWPDVTLAVNVSPLQFRRLNFVEMVMRTLDETGFDAHRLELELTESIFLGNLEQAEKVMRELKALGIALALDDFGTGYSSLLYLRTFPFDKLKIDRSFVHSIEKTAEAAAIVHAIVSLGRGLRMKVTAEGVETTEQHLFLRAAGVHSLQGYHFGRPQSAADITARVRAQAAIAPKMTKLAG